MPSRGLVAGPNFEYFQRRDFTPAEVAQHNQPEDLWVSYLGNVYNLTPLAQEYKGKGHTLGQRRGCVGVFGSWMASTDGGCSLPGDLLLKPIVEVAGQDISHWFDPKTRDVSYSGNGLRGGGAGGLKRKNRGQPEPEIVTAPTLLPCFKDSQAHRSADRFPEIPHPPGPLSARAASATPFGLGQ